MALKKDRSDGGLSELLYQALETELGGIAVYETAITCALRADLKSEWKSYLAETKKHRELLVKLLGDLGLDPNKSTPGRQVVASIGESLVAAMEMAKANGPAPDAQRVAAECVVHAETKDHMNWNLIGLVADATQGETAELLRAAYEEVHKEEAHHLLHTKGWTRELWLEAVGLKSVLPPPEEVAKVETPFGAARAEELRKVFVTTK